MANYVDNTHRSKLLVRLTVAELSSKYDVSMIEQAPAGSRLTALEAVRDRLAEEINDCTDQRALPNLVLRYTDVLEQIDGLPVVGQSAADQIAARRTARRATGRAK